MLKSNAHWPNMSTLVLDLESPPTMHVEGHQPLVSTIIAVSLSSMGCGSSTAAQAEAQRAAHPSAPAAPFLTEAMQTAVARLTSCFSHCAACDCSTDEAPPAAYQKPADFTTLSDLKGEVFGPYLR